MNMMKWRAESLPLHVQDTPLSDKPLFVIAHASATESPGFVGLLLRGRPASGPGTRSSLREGEAHPAH